MAGVSDPHGHSDKKTDGKSTIGCPRPLSRKRNTLMVPTASSSIYWPKNDFVLVAYVHQQVLIMDIYLTTKVMKTAEPKIWNAW
jgi:hypothetical protein